MTAERWEQIKDVLYRAMQVSPERRSAFLDQACHDDSSLRREVESLLAADDQARSSFLQAPPLLHLGKGTRLGDYEIQNLLGAGGMGEVYRARDVRLRREVAIKVLPAAFASDADRLRRFEQEATAAAALNHPNILAVYQMGTYEGAPYLVTELLEGETLREPIRRGRMVVRKAMDYGIQIARGLAAAHEKGIVHRDLKPENLFVTKDGRVKILDFGLAKLTRPEPGFEHGAPTLGDATEPGVVMGTVGYMAPEQVRGQAADHRADVFAFGAILYEMLAGKRAFQKPTSPETMTAILNEDPPGISQIVPNLPPALQRVVHRCLEKNPEQRFQSASDMAFALDAMTDSGASVASRTGTREQAWPKWTWIAAGVFLIAGVATLGWLSLRSRSSEAASIRSVAVFPFANGSNNIEMDYLGEGLSEEITNSISRLPGLQVMARSTVSHYKSRQDDPRGVGRDLHVDAVLTGRVVQHGNELEVETELVDVASGAQLWGERYTRSASDAPLLQTAITRDVAKQLRPQLTGNERDSLATVGTNDAEAYQLYLKGLYHLGSEAPQDLKMASDFFEKATLKDPGYAAAYAGLAETSAIRAYVGDAGPETMEKARSAANRAVQLDDRLAESHVALALANFVFWNFPGTEAEIRKALTLDPNAPFAHQVACWFNLAMARTQDAVAECRRSLELDPLSLLDNDELAAVYFMARDYDAVMEQARKTLELDPRDEGAARMMAAAYEQKKNYKQAVEWSIKGIRFRGDEASAATMRQAFDKSRYPGFLREDVKRREAAGDYRGVALDYAKLGEKDAVFAALEKAFASRSGILFIKTEPELDNIRSDPRFADLLRRMGLPQ
jgi:TolB-like protein/tetratricopeptide (TPR) repeat protein